MPKTTSKKAQKKGAKGGTSAKDTYIECNLKDGQLWARALRLLGSRNVLLYCNDDRVRIGHVCNRMRFRSWVEVGDIVLISIRDFETVDDPKKDTRRADILGKYSPEHTSTLKKEEGFNLKLTQKLESSGIDLSQVGIDLSKHIAEKADDLDDLFEEDEEGEDGSEESEEDKVARAKKASKRGHETKVAAADATADADELDIDAI